MSFILDALRKSEHERQRHSGPDFARPQFSAQRSGLSPPWIIAIAAIAILLGINLAVVLMLMQRDPRPIVTAPVPTPLPVVPQPLSPPSSTAFLPPPAVQMPAAPLPLDQPAQALAEPQLLTAPATTTASAARAPTASATPAPAVRQTLPTIHDLNLQGAQALPPLHLDIHVYAPQPAERFVFINMNKYREGGQMPDGIGVERITPEGVVLNRHGMRFVLPRP